MKRLVLFPLILLAVLAGCGGSDPVTVTLPGEDLPVIFDVDNGLWETRTTNRFEVFRDDPLCRELHEMMFGDFDPNQFPDLAYPDSAASFPKLMSRTFTVFEELCEITEADLPIDDGEMVPGCPADIGDSTFTLSCVASVPLQGCTITLTMTGSGTMTTRELTGMFRLEVRSAPDDPCGGLLCYAEVEGTSNWSAPDASCTDTEPELMRTLRTTANRIAGVLSASGGSVQGRSR